MDKKFLIEQKALLSLIFGMVSIGLLAFVFILTALVPIIFAILGIVFGVQSRKLSAGEPNGMATGGLVCSIIGLVLSSIVFVTCILCISVIGEMLPESLEDPSKYIFI